MIKPKAGVSNCIKKIVHLHLKGCFETPRQEKVILFYSILLNNVQEAEECGLAPPKLRQGAAQLRFNQRTEAGNTNNQLLFKELLNN
jgi:hypothetical protein